MENEPCHAECKCSIRASSDVSVPYALAPSGVLYNGHRSALSVPTSWFSEAATTDTLKDTGMESHIRLSDSAPNLPWQILASSTPTTESDSLKEALNSYTAMAADQ